jgi:hypothetical protein
MIIVGAPIYWFVSGYIKDQFAKQMDDLKTANQKLDDTIKSLQATIDYQDRKLASLTGGTTTIGENQNARLQYVNAIRISPPIPVRINLTFANKGNTAAVGATFRGSAQVSETALSDKDIDDAFDKLEGQLRSNQTTNTYETQPQDTIFITVVADNISQSMNDALLAGHARLYTFDVVRYGDENTPPGKHRVTEVCLIGAKDSADHYCPNHNRIFLSD